MENKEKMSPRFGSEMKSSPMNMVGLNTFKQSAEAEYAARHAEMVGEYKKQNENLQKQRDLKVAEYGLMWGIFELNRSMRPRASEEAEQRRRESFTPYPLVELERRLADLNYESVGESFTLAFWRAQFGDNYILQVLSEVISYFLYQFEVKEKLTDEQVMQFVAKLLAHHTTLRIKELVFVLNNALCGKYGPHYQRIGIDTILGWLNAFYEDSTAYLEGQLSQMKKESTQGSYPWLEMEKSINRYADEQRAKKRVHDRIWGEGVKPPVSR